MSDRNGIIRLPNPTGLPTARGAVGTPLGIIKAPDRRGFRPGRMRVLLTLHGGENALASVMAGLVERNARAIRNGQIPDNPNAVQNKLTYSREPVWLDGPSALAQGRCTAGTLAAWEAAHGHDARTKCYAEYGCQLYVDPEDIRDALDLTRRGCPGCGALIPDDMARCALCGWPMTAPDVPMSPDKGHAETAPEEGP